MGRWAASMALAAIAGLGAHGEAAAQAMRQVATGYESACGLMASGGVRCWGKNDSGQLGDGSTADHNAPLDVAGLTGGVTSIGMAWSHACAVTDAKRVLCWGDNGFGALGTGDIKATKMTTPQEVQGLANVATVAVGQIHACAVTAGGNMWCWGGNIHGQLGDGTQNDRFTPFQVLSNIASASTGTYHTCAVTRDGALLCWGGNGNGQLGDGTTTMKLVPTPVPGFSNGVTAVSAGDDQTCAIQSGKLFCWGANAYTKQQDGSELAVNTLSPVEIMGVPNPVASVSVGWAHTCAIGATGGARCWRADFAYELGTAPSFADHPDPTDVVGLASGVASISAGGSFSCAILTSGLPKCWGYNAFGEVGDSTNIIRSTAVDVSFPRTSYQGLWWNSPAGSESGWGINLTHQGDTLFATWFTYDDDGSAMWLIMSDGELTGPGTYHGALYRTTGPAYDRPFSSATIGVASVGDATFTFTDASNGTFRYTVNGVTQTKNITREIFGNAVPACLVAGPTEGLSVQDLWWNSPAGSESGWGLQLAIQDNVIFGAWFTYDHDGKALWLVMPRAVASTQGIYSGPIYRTSGPPFSSAHWDSSLVNATQVGTGTLTFSSATKVVMDMTVNGVNVEKTLVRELFRNPPTSCYF